MEENNKSGKERYLEHLNKMIFGNEMLFLSPEFVIKDCFIMKHDKAIIETFCEKTDIHGEKLKKILLLGYMENNKIENEGCMKNGQQDIVDIWID